MLRRLRAWWRKKPDAPKKRELQWRPDLRPRVDPWANVIQRTVKQDIVVAEGALDDVNLDPVNSLAIGMQQLPMSILSWYGSQSFVGYQACAQIATQGLVQKCCSVPARDAVRKGYEITVNDGTNVPIDVLDRMRKLDVIYKLPAVMEEFVTAGRVFGVRIAMFVVDSPDPDYYSKPFNIDGVRPGSYRGIVQVDPYWCTPLLDLEAGANPASLHFYEPTWWQINNRKVHRSHLIVARYGYVPDVLKPTYLYGGLPLPQLIYERVYCAERTANEAPQLALTKRANVLKTDMSKALANQGEFELRLQQWVSYRDNYGIKAVDLDEDVQQLDTSLAELDAAIMTQYQLVAAVANVPVTKLLGTTPKGFQSTGEFEEANYHEELESIQASWLTPLLQRHHMLIIRSELQMDFDTAVVWRPLDAMTAEEQAALNKLKAETGQLLMATGAIDGEDERQRIINDPQSGYSGVAAEDDGETEEK